MKANDKFQNIEAQRFIHLYKYLFKINSQYVNKDWKNAWLIFEGFVNVCLPVWNRFL